MKPTPSGWPRISSSLYYRDAAAAIDWLCHAFGFEVRLRIEGADGRIEHSELVYGDGVVMVGESRADKQDKFPYMRAPEECGGGNTQNMMVYVDDVDAHCERARAAGAKIDKEPTTTDYGDEYWTDRSYGCEDLGGHHWWFAQRVRSAEPGR
jgi:uncharacterized glyoxalase superfamily protein PhnB